MRREEINLDFLISSAIESGEAMKWREKHQRWSLVSWVFSLSPGLDWVAATCS
jgi:hypothetical protein